MRTCERRRFQIFSLFLLLLILLGALYFWGRSRRATALISPLPSPGTTPVVIPSIQVPPVVPVKPKVKPLIVVVPPPPQVQPPAVVAPPPPVPTPSVTVPGLPAPPPITLHKELIPKNIEIVRCYYDRSIVAPETTFGFDIDGSGFTEEFQRLISVDPGGLDIEVKNLRLVTANQIHGDMVVGPEQTTEFIYPKVLIHHLPVFRAPDPFAVVRRGEVLTAVFISLAEDGHSGRFRVITNLDEGMAKRFRVTATHPGLEISDVSLNLPFMVEGTMQISPGVPRGQYGMTAYLGERPIWHRDTIIHIVSPNVGLTGYVQGLSPEEIYHRPGDTVDLYLEGSGLMPHAAAFLSARVDEWDMGQGSFTYLSPAQMRLAFQVPANAPLQSYGVTVYGQKGQTLYHKKDLFTLVPPNWLSGVQITPPVAPGHHSLLKITGRDISPELARSLQIGTDEPGLQIGTLTLTNPFAIVADISVSTGVAPGDYLLSLTANGHPVKPQFGSVVKVTPP